MVEAMTANEQVVERVMLKALKREFHRDANMGHAPVAKGCGECQRIVSTLARAALDAMPEALARVGASLELTSAQAGIAAMDMGAMPKPGVSRERVIDALLETDLIGGYDWLGTGSSYPTQGEIREDVGEVADAILALLTPATPTPTVSAEAKTVEWADGYRTRRTQAWIDGYLRAGRDLDRGMGVLRAANIPTEEGDTNE
jgi:hypothetical protein